MKQKKNKQTNSELRSWHPAPSKTLMPGESCSTISSVPCRVVRELPHPRL